MSLTLARGRLREYVPDRGFMDSDFRPLRSPIPLLAIRQMVSSNLPFLIESSAHLAAYLHRFAAGIPGHARRILVIKASL